MGTGLTTYRIKGTGCKVLAGMQYCGPDQMVEGVASQGSRGEVFLMLIGYAKATILDGVPT